ncbi:MAG: TolC family protein [Deltaproteobacteria bacterium]|nr:TolC family protein [Deltaproteobacteria bacterium]
MLPRLIERLASFARVSSDRYFRPGFPFQGFLRERVFQLARLAAWIAAFISFYPGVLPLRAANEAPSADLAEEITVESAIAKAMRNNPTIVGRRLQQELNEIAYDNAWENMYLPKITLSSTVRSAYTVDQVPGSAARGSSPDIGKSNLNHGTPASRAALSLGEYTLYNFGKDRDAYQMAKLTAERSRQNIKEVERDVRFSVINAIYGLMTKQDLLDISQRSVDQAEAVYELIKSRIPLGKAQESDLASAEVDLLNAKNKLLEDETTYTQSTWALNNVLGDPIGHKYLIKAKIKFNKLKMKLEDAIRIYKETSPGVRDAKVALEQARITLRIAKKNFLPLPTVTFSGVTLGYDMGPRQSAKVRESTGSPSGNLDVSASVNFTIPLTGDGGIFNGRARRAAEISEEQAEIALRVAGNSTEIAVRSAYTQIVQQESTIKNAEEIFRKAASVFDASLKTLQSGTGFDRLDLKDAISSLRSAEQNYTSAILAHYNQEIELAKLIGVDELPEDKL